MVIVKYLSIFKLDRFLLQKESSKIAKNFLSYLKLTAVLNCLSENVYNNWQPLNITRL